MISQALFLERLYAHCRPDHPVQAALESCCREILEQFKFDCVFLAQSSAPEESPVPLAFSGKEEVMDTCLYRLGVEERTALAKAPFKAYADMTGKPVFNRSGSLRIQKPNSGVFMALHHPKKTFLLLGCAHHTSQSYDPKLLEELQSLWKGWQVPLDQFLHSAGPSAKREAGPAGAAESKAAKDEVPAPQGRANGGKSGRRSLVLVDEVTRLFNRDYFDECIAIEVERAKRYSRNMSVIFLSVRPSGAAGADDNATALQVAEILSKSLRKVDFICRLEKDKYGIILPDTANNTYGVIAKRIFKFFKLVMGEAPPVHLNISASTYPKHAADHQALLENAEQLLQQAREAGPNKAVLPE